MYYDNPYIMAIWSGPVNDICVTDPVQGNFKPKKMLNSGVLNNGVSIILIFKQLFCIFAFLLQTTFTFLPHAFYFLELESESNYHMKIV